MNYDKLENQLELEPETNKPNKVNINFSLFHLSPITLKISVALLFTICIIQSTILIVIIKTNNAHNNIQCLNNSNVNKNTSTLASSSALLVDNNDGSGNLLDIVNNTHIPNITNTTNITNTINTENTDNSILCGTRILTFPAGNYTLKPCDYKFAKFITVEMWGGGGAGSSYNGHGGASGGYIKATFPTNLQTFQISVGKGGVGNYYEFNQSSMCYNNHLNFQNMYYNSNGYNLNFGIPNNGSDSIFRSLDKSVNIISRGGKWAYYNLSHISKYLSYIAKYKSYTAKCIYNYTQLPTIRQIILNNTITIPKKSNIHYDMNGNNETFVMPIQYQTTYYGCGDCCSSSFVLYSNYFGYNGGNAPFGGSGGTGYIESTYFTTKNNYFTRKINNYLMNGNYPAGGGGGAGLNYDTPMTPYPCIGVVSGTGIGNGGDGLINIYF